MNQIDNLTDDAYQITQVALEDGSTLQVSLYYRPATQRWSMDISHPDIAVKCIAVCVHPNLVRDWRNLVSFGIACTTTTGQDPTDIEAFAQGRAAIYILSADEVLGVETTILEGPLQ